MGVFDSPGKGGNDFVDADEFDPNAAPVLDLEESFQHAGMAGAGLA